LWIVPFIPTVTCIIAGTIFAEHQRCCMRPALCRTAGAELLGKASSSFQTPLIARPSIVDQASATALLKRLLQDFLSKTTYTKLVLLCLCVKNGKRGRKNRTPDPLQ